MPEARRFWLVRQKDSDYVFICSVEPEYKCCSLGPWWSHKGQFLSFCNIERLQKQLGFDMAPMDCRPVDIVIGELIHPPEGEI